MKHYSGKFTYGFSILLCIFFYGCSCDDDSSPLPDLNWKKNVLLFNPCTNSFEILKTDNLYMLQNPNYPFNGLPQFIQLYYRPQQDGFFDCYGIQWFLEPPYNLVSERYLKNTKSIFRKCESSEVTNATARTSITVRSDDGNVTHSDLPIVQFGELTPGESIVHFSEINAGVNGQYEVEYTADPENITLEKNENNNDYGENFERSYYPRAEYFNVYFPSNDYLAKLKTSYYIFSRNQITLYN